MVEGEAPADGGAPVDGDRPRNPRNRNRGGRDRRNRNTNIEGGVAVEGGQQVVEGGEGQVRAHDHDNVIPGYSKRELTICNTVHSSKFKVWWASNEGGFFCPDGACETGTRQSHSI